jgi:hypothetical protein
MHENGSLEQIGPLAHAVRGLPTLTARFAWVSDAALRLTKGLPDPARDSTIGGSVRPAPNKSAERERSTTWR